MFIVFFLIWIIFNGKLTLEIAIFGMLVAALMYAFIIKFMGYRLKMDIMLLLLSGSIVRYLGILIVEIAKANIQVIKLIGTSRYELEPVVVYFHVDLKYTATRVLLANSITLTPGTITVYIKDNLLAVHCLDKSLANDLDESVFVHELRRIESKVGLPDKVKA